MIYLSTGAWNVAPTLIRFLRRHLFPPGAVLLTDWGPTHDRWFRSGKAHKLSNLRRLAAEFPDVKWLLIGDDGQHDDEIYTTFAERAPRAMSRPSRSGACPPPRRCSPVAARPSTTTPRPPCRGSRESDGAGLVERLEEVGVLER